MNAATGSTRDTTNAKGVCTESRTFSSGENSGYMLFVIPRYWGERAGPAESARAARSAAPRVLTRERIANAPPIPANSIASIVKHTEATLR